jgi:hypothetical protein
MRWTGRGVEAADLVFAHETVAAEELDALVDDPAVHLGDPQLGAAATGATAMISRSWGSSDIMATIAAPSRPSGLVAGALTLSKTWSRPSQVLDLCAVDRVACRDCSSVRSSDDGTLGDEARQFRSELAHRHVGQT